MAHVEQDQSATEVERRHPSMVCIVRATDDPREEHALSAYTAGLERPIIVGRSAKDDGLDGEVCSGRFERAVFADLDALLAAVWGGHVHLERWLAAGVRLELAEPPPEVDNPAWRLVVSRVCASLSRWRKEERRRRIIAATILSVAALVALATLLLLPQFAR